VPLRTCVGCQQTRPKRELIRLVRTGDGVVEVDPSGKKAGRGAYICPAQSCWEAGLKKNRLEHALRTRITAETRAQLVEMGRTFPRL
jgi:hypothetical protein